MYDLHLSSQRDKYAVIGDPISHSMSPAIHSACLNALEINASYEAVHVPKGHLKIGISKLIDANFDGFNVTIPHKVDVLEYLDELDPFAKEIGAVNTVIIEKEKLKGFNTDGPGFYQGLQAFYQGDVPSANILVIGAGGAARAIVATLAMKGATNLTVANRTAQKAKEMLFSLSIDGNVLVPQDAETNLHQFDLIINTTPMGMNPYVKHVPLSLERVQAGTHLSDIIYNPLTTAFLKQGIEKKCYVQNGVPMFIHQAAIAFKLWTGLQPDLKLMEQVVHHELGGSSLC